MLNLHYKEMVCPEIAEMMRLGLEQVMERISSRVSMLRLSMKPGQNLGRTYETCGQLGVRQYGWQEEYALV